MQRLHNAVWVVFLVVLLTTGLSYAQTTVAPPAPPEPQFPEPQRDDKTIRELQRKQLKIANQKRFKELKRDTDKLLQLATDLKLAVDRANENTLSLEVLKKASEIEKLSKEVQKKMRAE